VIAIVAAPLSPTDEFQEEVLDAIPVLAWWVRGLLVLIAAGLVAVFIIAALLNPYFPDGTARQMETHTTWPLRLPQCTFYEKTGLPCPSCGMTTSFALFIRGDILNSLRANCVGTLLAAFCLVLIPWSLASVIVRRPLFLVAIEPVLIWVIVVFLIVLLLRWAVVLAWIGWTHWSTS
jgi:hypothetical protein